MPIPERAPRRGGPALACAAFGWMLSTAAQAQLGASIAVDSDYRYRGVSLSDSKPSPSLTLNYDAPEHGYAGAAARRWTLVGRGSHMQLLGYAGWVTRVDADRDVEVGVDASHFTGVSGYDFAEAYVGLLAKAWSARAYYAPNYYGRHVRVAYFELNAHVALDEHARLFAHVGALSPLGAVPGDAGRARSDFSVGAGWAVQGWDFRLAAVAATRGGPYPAVYSGRRAAVVVGAAFAF